MQSSFSPVKSNFRARSCHLVSWAIPPRTEDCRVGPSSPTSTWDIPTWFDSLIAHSATATQMFRPLLTPSLSNAKKKKKSCCFFYTTFGLYHWLGPLGSTGIFPTGCLVGAAYIAATLSCEVLAMMLQSVHLGSPQGSGCSTCCWHLEVDDLGDRLTVIDWLERQ